MGKWEDVASAITINNGNLNFNLMPSSLTSLYAGTPLGAVNNYELLLAEVEIWEMEHLEFGVFTVINIIPGCVLKTILSKWDILPEMERRLQ
ncbi:MAG: hypothetical protein IPJ75_01390 [Ignavibacteriales bacterium]|nr:hypothetical protein [Ignavibacteriales bacterium]